MSLIEEKLKNLKSLIECFNEKYYNSDTSLVSDRKYDELLRELEELELKANVKNTTSIGCDIPVSSKKIMHSFKMFSIANTYNMDELLDFDKKIKKCCCDNEIKYVVEKKIDGVSLSLRYKDGKLISAATRGNGEVGENVTDAILFGIQSGITSIPLVLSEKYQDVEIKGEAFFTFHDFDNINDYYESVLSVERASNPRNLVSGVIKRKTHDKFVSMKIKFIAYSIKSNVDTIPSCQTDMLDKLSCIGFVTEKPFVADTMDIIIHSFDRFLDEKSQTEYPTDGLVIKLNNHSLWSHLGETAKFPRYMVAYKFEADRATTTVRDITWSVGRTGVITPVVIFDTVFLSNTCVSRATLYNLNEIERLGIFVGCTVEVEKRGEIIPKVRRVLNGDTSIKIEIPSNCPVCGSVVERCAGAVEIFCKNDQCNGKMLNKLIYFASRSAMDISGLGEKQLSVLFDNGIKKISDIYTMEKEKLSEFISHGKLNSKIVDNIMNSISDSKNRPLHTVLSSIGISDIGPGVAKSICRKLMTIDDIINCSKEDFMSIDGVGNIASQNLYDFFSDPCNVNEIRILQSSGMAMNNPLYSNVLNNRILENKYCVITGNFDNYSRKAIEDAISLLGGIISSSVSKKTTYVFAGNDCSENSKYKKAITLGVKIMNEIEMKNMIFDNGEA